MNTIAPDIVIAGVGRCGTTSLFRYLAQLSSIRIPKRKELDFLIDHEFEDISAYSDLYKTEFGESLSSDALRLEASPRYSLEPLHTAQKLKQISPEAKVILIFRDPVARLRSVYRAISRSGNIYSEVSLNDFIEFLFDAKPFEVSNSPVLNARYKKALHNGVYVEVAAPFVSAFGKKNVHLMFLDHLQISPQAEMRMLLDFIGLDPMIADNITYEIENPAVSVKSKTIYKYALKINASLEPLLNRAPDIRSKLRSMHNWINAQTTESKESAAALDSLAKVAEFYREPNRRFAEFVSAVYPSAVLPTWLNR